ncbi:hypothetical protein H0H87_012491 [Tephrocybe sp. NHM501043]|nr:hypothetical protein H0H87_012491 [Tephrocybe sp. NHM501043]
MPSFRTIFTVAAAAFAALSSAAPIAGDAPGVNQVAQLVGVSGVGNDILHGVNVENVDVTVLDTRADSDVPPEVSNIFADLIDSLTEREEAPASLPVILIDVKAKLEVVLGQLKALVDGKVNVDIEVLKPIIEDVRVIIAGALVSVKLIVGHPVEFILSLDGKVLAAVDVCQILISVLVLVHAILACVLHVVAAASIKIVAPLIAGVAAVLANLLVVIFVDLKAGIFVAIGPLLTPALLEALAAIKLDLVVAVLKKGTN